MRGSLIIGGLILLVISYKAWKKLTGPELGYLVEKNDVPLQPLDINLADSMQWLSLPGIGPRLSSRILKYRAARHGFSSIDDIKKIYGLSPETFTRIRPYLLFTGNPDQGNRRQWKKRKPKNIAIVKVNFADSLDWIQLPGIGPVLSSRILKYRSALGFYSNLDQLRKVYGLKEETVENLIPYLDFDSTGMIKAPPSWTKTTFDKNKKFKKDSSQKTLPPQPKIDFGVKKDKDLIIDINLTDSIDLIKLPGIGPKTAGRIIKYRSNLRFFRIPEQLMEVYGISPENFTKMRGNIQLDTTILETFKININTVSEKELASHPYLSWKDAQKIIEYRNRHGKYKSFNDLLKLYGLKEETREKIFPYFKF